MYHVIAPAPAIAPYPDLYVKPSDFVSQMRWLKRQRFHPVTLQRAYDDWTTGTPLPFRPIVISFDDGYLSQYTRAYKTLLRYRWPGVENIEVNFLQPFGGLRPWRVRKMIAAGWEIDAHTLTHPDLTHVSASRLVREVAGSRTGQLFLLPVRPLRRARHRGGAPSGLPCSDDDQLRTCAPAGALHAGSHPHQRIRRSRGLRVEAARSGAVAILRRWPSSLPRNSGCRSTACSPSSRS